MVLLIIKRYRPKPKLHKTDFAAKYRKGNKVEVGLPDKVSYAVIIVGL